MSMRRMLHYYIPVDDRPHLFPLTGEPVAVAAAAPETVEFWAEHDDADGLADRTFQVFGTGQPLPAGARWAGTCPRIAGLTWHLYEVSEDVTGA